VTSPPPADQAQPADQAPLRVSTLELFFDLVFVFTITQLTSLIAHDGVTGTGALRALLVFGVLWWIYGGYVWLTNTRTPSRTPERVLLLLGMAGFLVIGMAIPDAFSRRADGVALGLGYLLVVAVHGGLYLRVNRSILRVIPVNAGAAVLIIALGESVADIGLGADGHRLTAELVASAILGLALAAMLWWTYFGVGDDERAEEAFNRTAEGQRAQLALNAYFYSYIPVLLGIVLLAAGIKVAIQHPGDTLPYRPCLALAGGVALFLAGDVALRKALGIAPLRYRAAAAAACLVTWITGVTLSSAVEIALLAALPAIALVLEPRSVEA
jgi:low temperature requirement protein LtrA